MRAVHWGATGTASLMIFGGLLSTPASAAPFQDDLSVGIKVANLSPVVGTSTEYEVVAQNVGSDPASTAVLTVRLPATFAFESFTLVPPASDWACTAPAPASSGKIVCAKPTLFPSGEALVLRLKAVPGTTGAAVIRASVQSTEEDSDIDNRARLDVNVQAAPAPAGPPADKFGDPGYPPGWFGGYGYGGYGYGYGDYDDDYDDCPYYYDCY